MPGYAGRALMGTLPIATGGPFVQISGQFVFLIGGTLNVVNTIGRRSQASLKIKTDNTVHFAQDQAVQVFDQLSGLAFSGYIAQTKETKPGFGPVLEHELQLVDQHRLADKRLVAASYTGKPVDFIVQDIFNNILKAEGVTIGQISLGPFPANTLFPSNTLYPRGQDIVPASVTFGYSTVAQALDALAAGTTAGGVLFYWAIDQAKTLWFMPYTANVNTNTLDGTQIDQMNQVPYVVRGNPLYRNTQYVTGGIAQTTLQSVTRIGDGNVRSWALGYPLAARPTITLNMIGQSVGLKGTAGSKFYYAIGDAIITQDTSQTILTSSDTLVISYYGQYPAVMSDQNAAQVAYEQNLDGTTGIVEAAVNDTTITTFTDGLAEATTNMNTYGGQGVLLCVATRQSGYSPGQFVSVDLPDFALNNTQMLIEEVAFGDQQDGFNIWYTIKAVQGPYDTHEVAFLGRLFRAITPTASIAVGGTQTSTAVLANFTATVTPTATATYTVLACPVPNTTLNPATSLFPC